MALKAAVYCEAVSVTCPACRETAPDPGQGSEYWETEQLRKASKAGRAVKCDCGHTTVLRLPKTVSVLGRPAHTLTRR